MPARALWPRRSEQAGRHEEPPPTSPTTNHDHMAPWAAAPGAWPQARGRIWRAGGALMERPDLRSPAGGRTGPGTWTHLERTRARVWPSTEEARMEGLHKVQDVAGSAPRNSPALPPPAAAPSRSCNASSRSGCRRPTRSALPGAQRLGSPVARATRPARGRPHQRTDLTELSAALTQGPGPPRPPSHVRRGSK